MSNETLSRTATWSEWLASQEVTSSRQALAQRLYWSGIDFMSNPLAVIGFAIVLLLVIVAAFAPYIATHDPIAQQLTEALKPPSSAHWFGTDELGRDIFSRVIYGARITLYIVVLVSIIVGPIGLAIGMVAGYFGGWTERILMRVTDVFLSFPSLILALAFAAALGPGLVNAVIAIALTAWPPIARLARAETLTIRGADYVAAARLTGASSPRILVGQVLPMCLPSVVVRLTLNMAAIILTAAGLGFLGLGAQPPLPEWGAMTSAGRRFMLESWWVVTMPGSAILVVSLAFNLFGDGLRDLLDPRRAQ
jgi:peptide/nickel transport system permease protein